MKPSFRVNALVQKELRGSSRRWQTYGSRVLYVGLIALAVYNFKQALERYGPGIGASEYANLGRALFSGFLWIQIPFMALAALAGGSTMIVKEARAGTLGLLSIAGLSPVRIALGKWMAVMAQTISLILCGTPILAICFYLGGVGLGEVAFALAGTLATAGLAAAFAISASARHLSALQALLRSFLALVGYTLLMLIFSWFLFLPRMIGVQFEQFWVCSFGVAALSFFTIRWQILKAGKWVAVRILSIAPTPTFVDFEHFERYYGPPRRLGFRHRLWRSGVWEDRPLLWKELVTRPAAKMTDTQRAGLLTGLGFLAMAAWLISEGRSPEYFPWVGLFFVVLAATNGASLFVLEREGHRWDVFLSSPVAGWRIVRAKLLGGLLATDSLLALGIFFAALLAFGRRLPPDLLGLFAGTWTVFLAFAYVLGAAVSLRAPSLRSAVLLSLGVLFGLLFGLDVLLLILAPGSQGSVPPSFGALGLLQSLNPTTSVGLFEAYRGPAVGPGDPHVGVHLLFFFGFYGTAMSFLIGRMSGRFDRIVGRA